MTILAITNPMATQPQNGTPNHSIAASFANTEGPLAIQPSQGASSGGGSGQATSYSGFAAGAGGNGAQAFSNRSGSPSRPTDATSRSIVTAQTADQSRDGAPKVIDTAQEARETAAAMPDPLPTSPFLRGIKGDAD